DHQERRIGQRLRHLLAKAHDQLEIGDVALQHFRQVPGLFAGLQRGDVELREEERVAREGLRHGSPAANVLAHDAQDRLERRAPGPLDQQVKDPEDRKPSLHQGQELLVEDQKLLQGYTALPPPPPGPQERRPRPERSQAKDQESLFFELSPDRLLVLPFGLAFEGCSVSPGRPVEIRRHENGYGSGRRSSCPGRMRSDVRSFTAISSDSRTRCLRAKPHRVSPRSTITVREADSADSADSAESAGWSDTSLYIGTANLALVGFCFARVESFCIADLSSANSLVCRSMACSIACRRDWSRPASPTCWRRRPSSTNCACSSRLIAARRSRSSRVRTSSSRCASSARCASCTRRWASRSSPSKRACAARAVPSSR